MYSPSNVWQALQRAARKPWIRFAGTALGIYALWFMLYDLWLLPDGRVDAWLSHHVAWMSGRIVGLFGGEVDVLGRVVRMPGQIGVEVADGCNGLSTVGLFLGFVIAYPGSWHHRAWFVPLGMLLIYLTNLGRVVGLLYAQRDAPQFFDPLHSFGATTIFYVVVFALWVWWTRLGEPPQRSGAATSGGTYPVVTG